MQGCDATLVLDICARLALPYNSSMAYMKMRTWEAMTNCVVEAPFERQVVWKRRDFILGVVLA